MDSQTLFLLVFLASAFTVLGVTTSQSHVSEHILIAAAIGYGSLLWLVPLQRSYDIYVSCFVIAWWSGTMFYLGREVRDYEKGDSGKFDWGGFLGPAFGNIITFAISYRLYGTLTTKKVAVDKEGLMGGLDQDALKF